MTIDFSKLDTPIVDAILHHHPGIPFIFLEGFDSAIIGVAKNPSGDIGVLYDRNKMIAALERDGMREARADAWITAHIEETVPGPHAPVIARMMEGL
jgi:hypothetical protein